MIEPKQMIEALSVLQRDPFDEGMKRHRSLLRLLREKQDHGCGLLRAYLTARADLAFYLSVEFRPEGGDDSKWSLIIAYDYPKQHEEIYALLEEDQALAAEYEGGHRARWQQFLLQKDAEAAKSKP